MPATIHLSFNPSSTILEHRMGSDLRTVSFLPECLPESERTVKSRSAKLCLPRISTARSLISEKSSVNLGQRLLWQRPLQQGSYGTEKFQAIFQAARKALFTGREYSSWVWEASSPPSKC